MSPAIARETTRQHLDRRLGDLRRAEWPGPPSKGWIRAIRDGLGMTAAQLAKRLGVSQPAVTAMEQSEAERSISLRTLERAARALNCRLVYALVPEKSLDESVRARALELAYKRLAHVGQTMRLEDQAVDNDAQQRQLRRIVEYLLEHELGHLWTEE